MALPDFIHHIFCRVLDANANEKLHRVHVSYMSKCASLLVDDLNNFDDKLACTFCLATFDEIAKSSSKDQFLKVNYFLFLQFISRRMFIVFCY